MSVCIGICTYNGEQRLPETLEALGAMTAPEGSRVVVVDNASTDGTIALVRARPALANGLRVELVPAPDPGKTNAMVRLFAETDERIVLLLDDDCLPDPGWAEGLVAALGREPAAGIVGGPVRNEWRDAQGGITKPTRLAAVYRRSLGDQDLGAERCSLDEPMSFLMGASLGIRRSAMEASGWLEGPMLVSRTGAGLECGAEDAEVCIRIRDAGWRVLYEPSAGMRHVIYAHRQTAAYLARLREAICRGEPSLRWVSGEAIDAGRATDEAARAHRQYLKTLVGTWNPRRRVRLAERRGRRDGWRALAERLGQPRC